MKVGRRGFLTLTLGAIVGARLPRGEAITEAAGSLPGETYWLTSNVFHVPARALREEDFVEALASLRRDATTILGTNRARYYVNPEQFQKYREDLFGPSLRQPGDNVWPLSPQEIMDGARTPPPPTPSKEGTRNG